MQIMGSVKNSEKDRTYTKISILKPQKNVEELKKN